MSADTPQHAREQADHLHLRGLHVLARSRDRGDRESLKVVAELWQKAWELYREIGDASKSRELETSLAGLYKGRLAESHDREEQQGDSIKSFDHWNIFFKIGCFGFGGPMGVFTLLEDELVRKKKILTDKDFLEGAVLGNVLPGPVTMDIVTYTGYKLKKWSGALISTTTFILPSFLIMLILAMLYEKLSMTPSVEGVLKSLGAAVTGLILSVGLKLSKTEVKDYREAFILVGAFTASLAFKLDIVVIVAVAGLVGMFLYQNDPGQPEVSLRDYAA